MEIIIVLIIVLVILKILILLNLKKANQICKNKELDELTNLLPDNKTVCAKILQMIDNKDVKVEESVDPKSESSFYFVLTNSIKIANIQGSFTRIQTIAHECIHSIQNKHMLLFNFIFSNIYLIYFVFAIILTLTKVYTNINLQAIILLLLGLIYYFIRITLETDAILRSKDLAEGYLVKSEKFKTEEIEQIIAIYDKINKIGIRVINYQMIFNVLVKIGIFLSISILFVEK